MTETEQVRPPERIETERLVLRVPTLDDAPAMFANDANDPEVTPYLTWVPHPSVEETERVLAMLIDMWETGSAHPWAITIDDEIVGMIEAAIEPPIAEFGWVLMRSLWGQGLMAEAAGAVQAWLFDQPEIWRVEAHVDLENPGSSRVMEKIGTTLDGASIVGATTPTSATNHARWCSTHAPAPESWEGPTPPKLELGGSQLPTGASWCRLRCR